MAATAPVGGCCALLDKFGLNTTISCRTQIVQYQDTQKTETAGYFEPGIGTLGLRGSKWKWSTVQGIKHVSYSCPTRPTRLKIFTKLKY
jgi:hypothetical protein